ncbi:MAG: hypothetical protein AAF642_06660 [Pseudomonadota bacterium]
MDANISPKVVRALSALFPAHEFCSVGTGKADSDAPWISEFASAGGDGFIGLDKQIHNRPHEVKALQESGLNSCLFEFGKLVGLSPQAAVLVYAWPKIANAWQEARGGLVLRLRPTLNLNSMRLEQLEFWIDNGQPRLRKYSVHKP